MADDESSAGIVTLKKPLAGKLRERFALSFDWVLKRGWVDVEAEVQDCSAIRHGGARVTRMGIEPGISGYIVSFSYEVNGKTYDGSTLSKDEVQKGDKFVIRCDPQHPEENNTFDSETNWMTALQMVLMSGLVLLFVIYYLWDRLGHR